MKNLFAAMISLAGELGPAAATSAAGSSPGDSLDRFKRGFANATAPFRTHEMVCDPEAYERAERRAGAPEGFFPAYRRPERLCFLLPFRFFFLLLGLRVAS